jgi:hypothetical protein
MEFRHEAFGYNSATKQNFELVDGKSPTVTVKRGETNRISVAVTVTHTDIAGSNPAEVLTRPPLKLQTGWPFQTKYEIRWDVEVSDSGEIVVLGDPQERKQVKDTNKRVVTELKLDFEKSNAKYLAIQAQTKFSASGLKLDLPFVEGEGELIQIGGGSFESPRLKFLCKLVAEKQKESKPWPKISRELASTEVLFEKVDKDTVPNQSIRDLKAWTNGIKAWKDDNKADLLYQVIKDGAVPIQLEGNTSKSGSKDYNLKLAKRRIEAVERVLKTQLGSNKLAIVGVPKGKNPTEEDNDYKVDVFFIKELAEAAIANRQA